MSVRSSYPPEQEADSFLNEPPAPSLLNLMQQYHELSLANKALVKNIKCTLEECGLLRRLNVPEKMPAFDDNLESSNPDLLDLTNRGKDAETAINLILTDIDNLLRRELI